MTAASAIGDRGALPWTSHVVCYALIVLFPIFWMASAIVLTARSIAILLTDDLPAFMQRSIANAMVSCRKVALYFPVYSE